MFSKTRFLCSLWAITVFFFWGITLAHGQTYENIIVERNLFSPDRKPSKQGGGAESESTEPMKTSELQLYGVAIYTTPKGIEKSAILRVDKSIMPPGAKGEYLRVKEGQTIGPLKVVGIEKNQISVEYSGKPYIIPLYSATKKNVPPPPPVPPSPIQPKVEQEGKEQPVEGQRISPEEFEKLSPEEKEKLIERMKQAMIKRLEKIQEGKPKE